VAIMPRMTPSPTVPVGKTTTVGYGTSLSLFVLAAAAYLTGDRSQQTVGTIVAGALGGLLFVATSAGRFVQAHAMTKYGDVQIATVLDSVSLEVERAIDARFQVDEDDPESVHASETAPPAADVHEEVAAAEVAREPLEETPPPVATAERVAPPAAAEVPAAERRDLHDVAGA
jgi:uncharacterized membrane protein